MLVTEEPEAVLGALAEKCFDYPARDLTVFGVTGTHGKTSVVLMAGALLVESGRPTALLTTDGTDIGGHFTPATELAPDATDIARFLRDARAAGAAFAILEFSAYMLAHQAANDIPFAAVLQTDLAPRHVGRGEHRDFEAYRAAKAALMECEAPLAFLPYGSADFAPRGRVFIYGTGEGIDAELVSSGARSVTVCGALATEATLSYRGERVAVCIPVVGDFAVHNFTAAAALALTAGLSHKEIAAHAPAARPAGRLDCIFAERGRRVFLDAAYEAEDLARALSVLRTVTAGKLSVLLGSVGGRAAARRAPLGRAALLGADFVYFTADDPNSESPAAIARDMVAENVNSPRYCCIEKRERAIAAAVADLRAGDTLLILTKPRDETQLIGGEKRPFSDRVAVLDAIREL